MSFISKESNVVINAKLTSTGRKMLAGGLLKFDKFSIGDSEIDYSVLADDFNISENLVLKAKDNNSDIKYKVREVSGGENMLPLTDFRAFERRIVNVAPELGFFTGNTTDGFTAKTSEEFVIQSQALITSSDVTGGTSVSVTQSFNYLGGSYEPQVGDLMFINWRNPFVTGSTPDNGVINNNYQLPYLWYKIENVSGSLSADTLEVQVDRQLPNFNTGSVESPVMFYPHGDSINTYYTSGHTGCTECCGTDLIPVWNMSIVYSKNQAGLQANFEKYEKYDTTKFAGFKEYVGQTIAQPNRKCIGLIHYTNKSRSNNYGESLSTTTPVLELPTIYTNNSNGTIGLTLTCDTVKRNILYGGNIVLTYYDLKDQFDVVHGKVFNDLKVFVIENEELCSALSYKSNRNFTLPQIQSVQRLVSLPSETPLITTTGDKFYLTYMLETTSGSTVDVSYGLPTVLPCNTYRNIGVNGPINDQDVLEIRMPSINHLKKDKFDTGEGFTANKFYILINKNNSEFPLTNEWKKIDFTSQVLDDTNDIIDPVKLATERFRIDGSLFSTGATFDLNDYIDVPENNEPDSLQFGDEEFFFGNVKTSIESLVYRSQFNIRLVSNSFNTSINPTWSSGNPVYITEVAIYTTDVNNADRLVAIAKLSEPLEKKQGDLKLITITIDF